MVVECSGASVPRQNIIRADLRSIRASFGPYFEATQITNPTIPVCSRNNVLAEQVQRSVEGINFLDSGYSILATAEDGVVLAAGVWDRDSTTETTTVCVARSGWKELADREVAERKLPCVTESHTTTKWQETRAISGFC